MVNSVETFQANYVYCSVCGSLVFFDHYTNADGKLCAQCTDCARNSDSAVLDGAERELTERGWFYWYCLPGCLPDSEPFGPFATQQAALSDAEEMAERYAEESDSE